jgi:hypothetical protein
VVGTYAAVVAVCAASLAVGQAALALSGVRRWSWLAPAVGLALVCAVCWATVRLPGDGVVAAIVVGVATLASLAYLWRRCEGGGEALPIGAPVALLGLGAASLPFLVEGHFGILGTSFNPDMSQHLLATDRLAHGASSPLLHQGYPLGPHAVVVALNKGLGIGLVQGFDGLTIAVAVLAALTALTVFAELPALPRTSAPLLVALAYVVASYFAQGAFKETMQALFFLAFVLALREADRAWPDLTLRYVPAALIAVGSIYTYSFPGLIWLGGAAVLWLAASAAGGRGWPSRPHLGGREGHPRTAPAARALGLALLTFVVLTAPELGRMIDFQSFETFDPNGPGLGNLFGQVSPFEALGVWPSGDFRLAPGDGAVPALAYYLGIAFALALLAYGVVWSWRRRETAILAGLGAAALGYAAARLGGTPYTAAKAIELASPIVALTILMPLLGIREWRFRKPVVDETDTARLLPAALALFALAAGLSSLLALANAPVGPTRYSPALTRFRPLIEDDSTVFLGSPELLGDQHGAPYVSWELRGGRVCVTPEGELRFPPPGVRFVIDEGSPEGPPLSGLRLRRFAPPYVLWERTTPLVGKSPCPLVAVRQARQGAKQ